MVDVGYTSEVGRIHCPSSRTIKTCDWALGSASVAEWDELEDGAGSEAAMTSWLGVRKDSSLLGGGAHHRNSLYDAGWDP